MVYPVELCIIKSCNIQAMFGGYYVSFRAMCLHMGHAPLLIMIPIHTCGHIHAILTHVVDNEAGCGAGVAMCNSVTVGGAQSQTRSPCNIGFSTQLIHIITVTFVTECESTEW
jgi:hypothetical protein